MVPHHDADPVAVRVGAQNEVHVILFGQIDGQIEPLRVFRVGRDHRGEIAVDDHLLRHGDQVLDAQRGQRLRHQLVAAAVEGGVDQLEGVRYFGNGLTVVDHGGDIGHELPVRFVTHGLNETALYGFLKVHPLHTVKNVDLLQPLGDGVGVVGGKLRAVGPVDLVAVVLLGVVAGGDIDACLTAVFPDGEAQFRGGPQGVENADVDAIGGADLGGGPGELHRVIAAVHADSHAPVLALLALGGDDVGKALSGPADHMDVHVM